MHAARVTPRFGKWAFCLAPLCLRLNGPDRAWRTIICSTTRCLSAYRPWKQLDEAPAFNEAVPLLFWYHVNIYLIGRVYGRPISNSLYYLPLLLLLTRQPCHTMPAANSFDRYIQNLLRALQLPNRLMASGRAGKTESQCVCSSGSMLSN